MNFREVMERYKEGTLSEEEKIKLEKEIEKFEILETYFSERFDEEINHFQETDLSFPQQQETRKLRKSVNLRLFKVVIASVLSVILLYLSVFVVGSNLVDQFYYDPTKTEGNKLDAKMPNYFYDMLVYTEVNMPGYSLASFTSQESKGFGKYELSYSLRDLFNDDTERYEFILNKDVPYYALEGIDSTKNRFSLWNGFENISIVSRAQEGSFDEYESYKNADTLKYLDELNPCTYVSLAIVFEDDLNMEEYFELEYSFTFLDFAWVGIRTFDPGDSWNDSDQIPLVGFQSSFRKNQYNVANPDSERYPNLFLNEISIYDVATSPELVSEAYSRHFRSCLAYLRDREDFVRIFDYSHLRTDFYNQAIEYIDENGVNAYGTIVYGTPDELKLFLQMVPYQSICIKDASVVAPDPYASNWINLFE